mmetsp:Transcript_38246/g.112169  ORF Transcript_38246/g.112169 Transcript_38246/m.112169 type:complete len:247 (+) Transcript_38246:54-794(+)
MAPGRSSTPSCCRCCNASCRIARSSRRGLRSGRRWAARHRISPATLTACPPPPPSPSMREAACCGGARARARASDGRSRSEAQRRSTWSATGVKTSRASVSPSAGSSAQRRLIRCERIADSSAAADSQERKRRRVGSVAVWYATGKTWQTHSRRYSCASPSLHDTISSSSGCTTSAVYTCSVTPSSEARRCKLPPTTTLSSARSFSRCSLFAAGPWCCIRTQSFAISPKLARTILIASETVPPSPS